MPLFCLFCREPLKEAEVNHLRKIENPKKKSVKKASSIEIKKEEQSKIMEKQNSGLKSNDEKKEEESKIVEKKNSVKKKNSGLERPPKKMSEQPESDQEDEES